MIRKSLLILIFFIINVLSQADKQNPSEDQIIVDCNYTFHEAISGIVIPKSILKQITLVDVEYYSFDGKLHKGQVVINKAVKKDIQEIFQIIKKNKFPIAKVIPIVRYNWSDKASMEDNNTSSFNYRKVDGQKILSPHSFGLAIDINPMQNPHIKSGKFNPPKAKYDPKANGTILKDSKLVLEFQKRGWQWGGFWQTSKDYQHFEKKL